MTNTLTFKLPTSAVDRLGQLRAIIADLSEEAETLKTELIAQGAGEYDGRLFRATVSRVSRSYIDSDAARRVLDERTLEKITKHSSTYTVRVSARKAA